MAFHVRVGGNKWQHNPEHRGGAPYKDRATADRFGGTARGDSLANRQASARQQMGRQGGDVSRSSTARTAQATAPAGMVWAIVAEAPVLATGPAEAEPIASEAAISRAAVAETATPSEEDREDTADRALAAAAAAVPQAWDLEGVEAAFAEAAVAGGADR